MISYYFKLYNFITRMLFQMLIFLTVVIVVVGGANAIIYQALVRFLAVQSPSLRLSLLLIQTLLSFGFIGASVLTRFSAFWLTRALYWIASVWLGFFMYLFLACAAAWLIYIILSLTGSTWDMKGFMAALLALAFALTAYGLVNARFVKVTHITVDIAGLPESWEGRKAVQLSDVHLGAVNNGKYIVRLRALAKAENPDLIFFTGDYFDGSWPSLNDIGARLKDFTAPLGVYFINGNHEIYDGRDKVAAAVANTGVQYLKDEIKVVDGVQILGLDWPERDFGKRDLGPVFAKLDPDKPAIALYHEPRYLEAMKAAGIDLLLSGHTHRGQMYPAGLVTRLIYGPCHSGLCRDGDFTIYTSSGAGTWGPPLRVGTRPEIVVITFIKRQ